MSFLVATESTFTTLNDAASGALWAVLGVAAWHLVVGWLSINVQKENWFWPLIWVAIGYIVGGIALAAVNDKAVAGGSAAEGALTWPWLMPGVLLQETATTIAFACGTALMVFQLFVQAKTYDEYEAEAPAVPVLLALGGLCLYGTATAIMLFGPFSADGRLDYVNAQLGILTRRVDAELPRFQQRLQEDSAKTRTAYQAGASEQEKSLLKLEAQDLARLSLALDAYGTECAEARTALDRARRELERACDSEEFLGQDYEGFVTRLSEASQAARVMVEGDLDEILSKDALTDAKVASRSQQILGQ